MQENICRVCHAKCQAGGRKDKLKVSLHEIAGEMSITSDMQMTPPLWKKVKRN